MNACAFLYELRNTETMIFTIDSEPHVPGVGSGFFVDLGRFNAKNSVGVRFTAEFPQENAFNLVPVGERSDGPLDAEDIRVLLDFFEPYFLHSYSRQEFVGYLKDHHKK
jgi:hypothetical protein